MHDHHPLPLSETDDADHPDRVEPAELSRRAALAKLGKLAGYTAPVVLTLLVTPRKAAASPPGDPG